MRSSYVSCRRSGDTPGLFDIVLTPLGKRSLKIQIGSVFDQIAQSMCRRRPITNDFELLSQALQGPFPHGQRLIQPRHDGPAQPDVSHTLFYFYLISSFIFICDPLSCFVMLRCLFHKDDDELLLGGSEMFTIPAQASSSSTALCVYSRASVMRGGLNKTANTQHAPKTFYWTPYSR